MRRDGRNRLWWCSGEGVEEVGRGGAASGAQLGGKREELRAAALLCLLRREEEGEGEGRSRMAGERGVKEDKRGNRWWVGTATSLPRLSNGAPKCGAPLLCYITMAHHT